MTLRLDFRSDGLLPKIPVHSSSTPRAADHRSSPKPAAEYPQLPCRIDFHGIAWLMTGVKDEHTAKNKMSFRRKLLYGISGFFLVFAAWLFWQVFAFNNAVQMAEEAGFVWYSEDPITLVRKDWRNALKKDTWNDTWRPHNRELQMPG